jgi:uncharacterized damage-inducible protein DinB
MKQDELVPSPVWGGISTLSLHFGFNQWANERILTQAAKLSDADLHASQQNDHGSAFQLLLHALDTEWGWRIVCQQGIATQLLWEVENIPDLPTLAHFWQGEHELIIAYLRSLQDADLNRAIDIGTIFGNEPKYATLANLLTHILYHSHKHRGEIAIYLTQCGFSPGNIDFLDYVLEVAHS